jgi:hypothetical protein
MAISPSNPLESGPISRITDASAEAGQRLHSEYMAEAAAPTAAPSESAAVPNMPEVPQGVAPETWKPISDMIANNKDVQFIAAGEGDEPDYILGADGRLMQNPRKQPSTDGPVKIQVDNQAGPEAAKTRARELQVAAVQEKIYYWQKAHPNEQGLPTFLKSQLADAQNTAGIRTAPEQPRQSPGFQPDAPPDPSISPILGGGGGGRGYGGGGGGGGRGYSGGDGGGCYSGGDGGGGVLGRPAVGDFQISGDLVGNTRAQMAYNFFLSKGLPHAACAGIIGNMVGENPSFDPARPGDGGNAIGTFQFNGPRRHALFAFAREHNVSAIDFKTQLNFAWYEMNTSERGSLVAMQQARTPDQAARDFCNKFERPGVPHMATRVSAALQAYRAFGPGSENMASIERSKPQQAVT